MMPQVTKTTNQLIISSLYLLGELGTNEIPDAFMLNSGMELINELLTKFAADSIYIPYLTEIKFYMKPGKHTYSISDITPAYVRADRVVDLSFANYFVPDPGYHHIHPNPNPNPIPDPDPDPIPDPDDHDHDHEHQICYPLKIINKAQYYGVTRLTHLNTRPGFIFLDKQPLESFVTLYPAPDRPYKCLLGVKSMIDSLKINDDLSELPPFYYGFLKYCLARKFLSYYPSGNWNDTAEQEYQDYFSTIKNANETDVTVRPSAILSRPEPFYWQNILAY